MAGDVAQDVGQAIGELYAVPPDQFVGRRDALAAAVRSAGDAKRATEIKRLRKPTVSAWAINMLTRRAGETLRALLELGPALAKAQRQGRRDELRNLGEARQRYVTSLVAAAGAALREHGQPISSAIALDIESTLAGALADADVAEAVLSGRLDRPVRYAGLGPVPALRLVPTDSAQKAGGDSAAGEAVRDEAVMAEPPVATRPAAPDIDELADDVKLAGERYAETVADSDRLAEERARLRREYDDLRSRLEQLEVDLRAADQATNQTRREVSRAERDLERAKRMLDRARERHTGRRPRT